MKGRQMKPSPVTRAIQAGKHWGAVRLSIFPDADVSFKMVRAIPPVMLFSGEVRFWWFGASGLAVAVK